MASFVPHIGTLENNRDEAVALAPADQKRHVYIAGKSGTGKSTLLRNMIVANLSSGDGVTLLDPHGSLYDDVLDVIPRSRSSSYTNDVILIDPTTIESWASTFSNRYIPTSGTWSSLRS